MTDQTNSPETPSWIDAMRRSSPKAEAPSFGSRIMGGNAAPTGPRTAPGGGRGRGKATDALLPLVVEVIAKGHRKGGDSGFRWSVYQDGMLGGEYVASIRGAWGEYQARRGEADLDWDSQPLRRLIVLHDPASPRGKELRAAYLATKAK